MNYTIENKNDGASVTLDVTYDRDGVTVLELAVSFDTPTAPQPIGIRWSEPCCDMLSTWRTKPDFDRTLGPDRRKRRAPSQLASCAPVMAWISASGENRLTVTVSDAMTPTEISGDLDEYPPYLWR